LAGDALEFVGSLVGEVQARADDEVVHRTGHEYLGRLGDGSHARADVNGEAADVVAHVLDLAPNDLLRGVRREAGGPASENRPAGHLWARRRGLDAPDRLRRRTTTEIEEAPGLEPGLLARAMMHKLWDGGLGQMG